MIFVFMYLFVGLNFVPCLVIIYMLCFVASCLLLIFDLSLLICCVYFLCVYQQFYAIYIILYANYNYLYALYLCECQRCVCVCVVVLVCEESVWGLWLLVENDKLRLGKLKAYTIKFTIKYM